MTREEATEQAARLGRDHADRATHRWMPQETATGEWAVVKVKMPPGVPSRPLTETTEERPAPPTPDDPRTSYERNVGGNWIA